LAALSGGEKQMRDKNFGSREPAHKGSVVHVGSQHAVKEAHESVGQPESGSSAKHLAASRKIIERVRQKHLNAINGHNEGGPNDGSERKLREK
jgi:hypothetical protein